MYQGQGGGKVKSVAALPAVPVSMSEVMGHGS